MKRVWTKEEDANLKSDYPNLLLTRKIICDKYRRTWVAIKLRATKLGYTRKKPINPVDELQVITDYKNTALQLIDVLTKHGLGLNRLKRILTKHNVEWINRTDHYTNAELNQLAIDYTALTTDEILKKWPTRTWCGIRSTAKRLGFPKRPTNLIAYGKPKERNLPYTEKEIVKMYAEDKQPIGLIAKKCDTMEHVIRNILIKEGCTRRSCHEAGLKYQTDEHYFDVIDSHNKAYLLGLFAADGCNHQGIDRISISLQNGDRAAIEFFAKELKTTVPIRTTHFNGSTKQDQTGFSVHSRHMCNTLAAYGMPARKSLIITFPPVPDAFVSSFILGNMDGDGCVYFSLTSKNRCVQFISTIEFLTTLQAKLKQFLDITPYPVRFMQETKKNNYRLSIHRQADIIKLFYWLYGKSGYWFDRKYQKFAKIVAEFECKAMRRAWAQAQIVERSRFKTSDDYVI